MSEAVQPKRRRAPWIPPTPPPHVTLALKALESGTASDVQQRAALKWIIEELCATYDWGFMPTGERETNVMLGRQLVGKQLVHELKINPAALRSRNP